MMNTVCLIQQCLVAKSSVICRKRHLTIFELLLVAAILALAGGAVAININKALINQRFQTEANQVVGMLQLAQDLMLIVDSDVHVKFAKADDGIRYWLELETALPLGIQEQVMRPRKPLKTIHGVFFKDALDYKPVYGQIDLKFLSNGAVMSQGMMRLSTSEEEQNPPANSLHTYICLPGYPYPIAHFDDWKIAEEACGMNEDQSYDDRIAQDTFSKLPESLKQIDEPEKEESEEEPKKSGDSTNSGKKTSKTSKQATSNAD